MAILVFQNNETAAVLVFQTNPVVFELYSYINAFFRSNEFPCMSEWNRSIAIARSLKFSLFAPPPPPQRKKVNKHRLYFLLGRPGEISNKGYAKPWGQTRCIMADIHFCIYDDVTHHDILGFQRKISIHIAFGPLLFWPLLSMPWDHVLFVKEYQRNMWNKRKIAVSLQSWEKSAESEANACVEWSLNSCKFQVRNIFSVFEKILRGTKVNLLVDFSYKIHLQLRYFSSYARPLKIKVWSKCVISAPLLVHCVSVLSIF